MNHYTLNTGHTRQSPRSEVRDDVIETCKPWCEKGWHDLPMKGWRLRSTQGDKGSLVYTLYDGEAPIITCGVARDSESADEVWPVLEGMYLDLTDRVPHRTADWKVAKKPTDTPWIAVVLVALTDVYYRELWIGDFERCIAWAWVESEDGD